MRSRRRRYLIRHRVAGLRPAPLAAGLPEVSSDSRRLRIRHSSRPAGLVAITTRTSACGARPKLGAARHARHWPVGIVWVWAPFPHRDWRPMAPAVGKVLCAADDCATGECATNECAVHQCTVHEDTMRGPAAGGGRTGGASATDWAVRGALIQAARRPKDHCAGGAHRRCARSGRESPARFARYRRLSRR